MSCEKCGNNDPIPFTCSYCKQNFCVEHRLPENHECRNIWMARTRIKNTPISSQKKFFNYPKNSSNSNFSESIFSFSKIEIKHLGVGTLLVTLVGLSLTGSLVPNFISFSLALLFSLSFLLHEVAHKLTAQKYGLWSEFRLIPFGVILTIASIIFPFKIIAPGTVIITGKTTTSTIGRTAFSGPLTNILLGYTLLILSITVSNLIISEILSWGTYVNAILAVFNLIPFGILDGQKIISWNIKVWAVALTFSAILIFINNSV
ncbi:AN1-type zinc finger domain-containing protein [Thermoproteota archaeon]